MAKATGGLPGTSPTPSVGGRTRNGVDAAARVRNLIALDAANLMARLEERAGEMVALFSRLRDRAPLLTVLSSWFTTATFGDLAALSPAEQSAVDAFYRVVSDLRWYVQYTEDMPLQLERRIGLSIARLRDGHAQLNAALEGKPPTRAGSRTPRPRRRQTARARR